MTRARLRRPCAAGVATWGTVAVVAGSGGATMGSTTTGSTTTGSTETAGDFADRDRRLDLTGEAGSAASTETSRGWSIGCSLTGAADSGWDAAWIAAAIAAAAIWAGVGPSGVTLGSDGAATAVSRPLPRA